MRCTTRARDPCFRQLHAIINTLLSTISHALLRPRSQMLRACKWYVRADGYIATLFHNKRTKICARLGTQQRAVAQCCVCCVSTKELSIKRNEFCLYAHKRPHENERMRSRLQITRAINECGVCCVHTYTLYFLIKLSRDIPSVCVCVLYCRAAELREREPNHTLAHTITKTLGGIKSTALA